MVIAYLMKSGDTTFEGALESVKEHYPAACPNPGFIDQLKIFGRMGCKLDESHPEYKHFKLKVMSYHVLCGGKVLEEELESIPKENDAQDSGVRICCTLDNIMMIVIAPGVISCAAYPMKT